MKKTILLISAIVLLLSCSNSKKVVYDETDFQIFFGNYGGFANMKMEYVLNDDRNVFKLGNDLPLCVNQIAKSELKEIKALITKSGFENLDLNSTGNMTYFIRVKSDDLDHQIKWATTENMDVTGLYSLLLKTIKSEK